MNDILIKTVLNSFNIGVNFKNAVITPFFNLEDGGEYNVWCIKTSEKSFVLKQSKGKEADIYRTFFSDPVCGAPVFYGSACADGVKYLLIEYIAGESSCILDRDSAVKTLDALISLQEKYWGVSEEGRVGVSFSESLESRINRGKYLKDPALEKAYSDFIETYGSVPRTLCHDDLLPFNVIVSPSSATLIDWEYAGILPYPASLARLIAHTEEKENAFFYMKEDDKSFAIDYYFEKLVKHKGVSYEEYRRTLDLFILYEYCEWIMLGNKYEDADMDRFNSYLKKAKEHVYHMTKAPR